MNGLVTLATTIMDRSLGTLLHFWGVFQFTQVQPLPSPHKQCWTRVCRIFLRVSTLYWVGGGRTARNFRNRCTVLRGNREMTEKYKYCSTVPIPILEFVQDCRPFKICQSEVMPSKLDQIIIVTYRV